MGKKIAYNVVLNILIIISGIVGIYAFKLGNYFVPILCAAAGGLSIYYKIKLMQAVKEDMKIKADEKVKKKSSSIKKKK